MLTTLTSTTGNLSDLNTVDKSNLVAAINEALLSAGGDFVTPEAFGAVGDGVADDTQAVIDAATYAASEGLPMILKADYNTDSTCVTEGVACILVTGHISNLWIRNAYGGYYVMRAVDTLKMTSIKNAVTILGELSNLTLVSDELLSTMPNAGIAYNTFIGGHVVNTLLTGSNSNEWINENRWYGTRMNSVTITGVYGHNNNIFEDVTLEGGTINLTNALSNHFRIRGEGGYTLNADVDSYNNTFVRTYSTGGPLSFCRIDEQSKYGNVETSDWIYKYDKYPVFSVNNRTHWHNDNDYTNGKVQLVAWNTFATRQIIPTSDCIFHIFADDVCFRPHFRLYKNGSVVLTRSNAVYGTSLNFDSATGDYYVSSNLQQYIFGVSISSDFDMIEVDAYPSKSILITEMRCEVYTLGRVVISPDPTVPLVSSTKPTNNTAPYGTYVGDSTGSTAGWIRTSTDWQEITVS